VWAALSIALVAATAYITSRVCAQQAKRVREEEERRRRERRRELTASETKYLKEGFDDSSSSEIPDVALRSLGNVAYLVWLLNYESRFRNYRGDGKNPYPPDWEWRRRFVFLRDRGICQGCKKHSSQGITLDCHHIKAISEFGPDELGIHSLNNLVSLCQLCHAGQHLGNQMLAGRASRSTSHDQDWSTLPSKQRNKGRVSNITAIAFEPPAAIEVHPPSEALFRSSQFREPQVAKENAHARSISDGLAWVDDRISDLKFQDAMRRCAEEDIYDNCDYCDREILLNPFHMNVRGKYLCDECYGATGGKE
jgi:5-methylcytosine-specific restriction endonuclease McrA